MSAESPSVMRKKSITKQIEALDAAKAALSQELLEEQDRDISATQSDLGDVKARLAALAQQQINIMAFIENAHSEMLNHLNNQRSQMVVAVGNMLDALTKFEKDRERLLESRLRGMKGEESAKILSAEQRFHNQRGLAAAKPGDLLETTLISSKEGSIPQTGTKTDMP